MSQSCRRPKASDIPDLDLLRIVREINLSKGRERGTPTACALVCDLVPRFQLYPWKVVNAKLERLKGRGLLTGCSCGCRGDWELTATGAALLERQEAGDA